MPHRPSTLSPSAPLWSRALRTPLSQLLRGRVASGQRVESVVAASSLAPALRTLVLDVTRRTRLLAQERVDVARELVAHFEDGAESGYAPAELLERFGDVPRAARLIRRGKLRSRPVLLRVQHRVKQVTVIGGALLVVLYAALCVRFYGSTGPELDTAPLQGVAAGVNQRFERMPSEEIAWPELVSLHDELKRLFKQVPIDAEEDHAALWRQLGGAAKEYLPPLVKLARKQGDLLERMRTSAGRPELGFRLRVDTDAGDVVLPDFHVLGTLARVLREDLALAVEHHEHETLYKSIQALLQLAAHIERAAPCSITSLTSWRLINWAAEATGRALASGDDGLLTDPELLALQARFHALSFELATEGDEAYWKTLRTAVFSNGRITAAGLERLQHTIGAHPARQHYQGMLVPALSPLLPSETAVRERSEALFGEVKRELVRPLWERRYPEAYRWQNALDARSFWNHPFRSIPRLRLDSDELAVQQRDAVLCAIALVRYRRRHERWAQTLRSLVPEFLSEVPRDRLDGQPLRYRLEGDRPLLYSVGVDRDDDQGRAAEWANAWEMYHANRKPIDRSSYDGDWVLWPLP